MREKNNLRGQKNKIRKKTSWNKLWYNSYLELPVREFMSISKYMLKILEGIFKKKCSKFLPKCVRESKEWKTGNIPSKTFWYLVDEGHWHLFTALSKRKYFTQQESRKQFRENYTKIILNDCLLMFVYL